MSLSTGASLPSALQRARIGLMLDQPFLASAVARLPLVNAAGLDWCETMATDGYYIYVNPAFLETLSPDEITFVLAHEVLHCVLGHLDRRGEREQPRWNWAVDYATNQLLVDFGLRMPRAGLLDPRYAQMTAETIYLLLAEEAQQQPHGSGGQAIVPTSGSGQADDRGPSGFDVHLEENDPRGKTFRQREFPSEIERKRMRIELTRELTRELGSRAQGYLSGSLQEELQAATKTSVPWAALLARFMTGIRRSDYRLFPPNRKHVWRGLYLPSVGVPGPEHLVVAIDTSGSMSAGDLARALGEINRLRAMTECRLTLIQCDATIQDVSEYDAFEEPAPPGGRAWVARGRGGTDLRPVFDWIRKQAFGGMRLDALIYLTDGYGTFPERPPAYPVLWLATAGTGATFPFGHVIVLE